MLSISHHHGGSVIEPPRPRIVAAWVRVVNVLFGTEPKLRFALTIWAVSFFTYLLYAVILLIQVGLGLVSLRATIWLTASSVLMNLVFYTLIRSGASRSRRDRGLGLEQLLGGMVFMWLNYSAVGPAAGATLVIMASQIVYAIFAMPSQGVWRLAGLSLLGLAVTMLICHAVDPVRYPAGIQLSSYLYAAVVIPLIARLAHYVTRMQDIIRQRGSELQATLAKVQELATRDELTQTYNRCLPDTSSEHAGLVMLRMRQQLRKMSFENPASDLKVTFSAGVAELRAGESIAEAIKRADQAMYRAKRAGRDRYELH